MLLFQYLQYADVGDTTRTAARKDQTDTGPGGKPGERLGSRVRGLLREGDGRSGQPEGRTNNAQYPETGPDRPW
jgi:hypothetical protein